MSAEIINRDTVTISLETYENMKAEIKSLKAQVQQKTVYVKTWAVPNELIGPLFLLIVMFGWIFIYFTVFNF